MTLLRLEHNNDFLRPLAGADENNLFSHKPAMSLLINDYVNRNAVEVFGGGVVEFI